MTDRTDGPASDEPRILAEPDLRGWDFLKREAELLATASSIPTWRMADIGRRFLADTCEQVSAELGPRPPAAEMPAAQAVQYASVMLSGIAVRAAGAIITCVGTGYEREAYMPGRVLLEASLRLRQALDDDSGSAARAILLSRPQKSIKQIAKRYGDPAEVAMLDRFSHADVASLLVLMRDDHIDLRPARGTADGEWQLYNVGYLTGYMAAGIAQAFEVGVLLPPYLDAQIKEFHALREQDASG